MVASPRIQDSSSSSAIPSLWASCFLPTRSADRCKRCCFFTFIGISVAQYWILSFFFERSLCRSAQLFGSYCLVRRLGDKRRASNPPAWRRPAAERYEFIQGLASKRESLLS